MAANLGWRAPKSPRLFPDGKTGQDASTQPFSLPFFLCSRSDALPAFSAHFHPICPWEVSLVKSLLSWHLFLGGPRFTEWALPWSGPASSLTTYPYPRPHCMRYDSHPETQTAPPYLLVLHILLLCSDTNPTSTLPVWLGSHFFWKSLCSVPLHTHTHQGYIWTPRLFPNLHHSSVCVVTLDPSASP